MAKRILAFHAHPDDVEILAGGTLALLASRGHHITIATMTAGDCGSMETGPEETAAIRRAEAQAAAALIGADARCAGLLDLAVFNDDATRRLVTSVIREARPDIIITASPVDYMCDHQAASALVRDASFGAPIPNYRAGGAAPLAHIPHLYYMQPIGNRDLEDRLIEPDFTVDIAAAFETKRAMLACHASQRDWLRRHHGMDEYLESMERWSRELGERAGFALGEGFRRYRGHAYPSTPLLEQLLGCNG